MTIIFVTDRQGVVQKLKADLGMSLMEIIREAGLDIEAACGGCCACATCHLYIDKKWLEKISKPDEDEESMLDQAFHVNKYSRLGCQIQFSAELDEMEVELAPE